MRTAERRVLAAAIRRGGSTNLGIDEKARSERTWLDGGSFATRLARMHIEIRTDSTIHGDERLQQRVTEWAEHALARFARRITRVEVHLSDENGRKDTPGDTKCVMEARLEKLQPTVVTEHADNVEAAVRGAAGKLTRALEHELGRLDAR
jgi:ribosome-associated translation inhibitor RaiA